ncbi:class I SAM-dependent methyltransferase [Priestia megaterium]|uniref:class I SAM-dependent methyltransferase n=1 Tax=Priestia megaterium TaxID=1404 RepID=UPI002E1D0A91|nr:class I SAM-dependent methyltransferase [Priestia megaterium]
MGDINEEKFSYIDYWEDNYSNGGTSGKGSYGVLAQFKGDVINQFIKGKRIHTVIEFGCGDGNQLKYMNYPSYLGMDISPTSIDICSKMFEKDKTKSFLLYNPKYFINNGYFKSDLVVCLDVLYHITNEDDFWKTLDDIFSCKPFYIILYTRVTKPEEFVYGIPTIQDRDILSCLSRYQDYKLIQIIEQKYKELSGASFIILEKV